MPFLPLTDCDLYYEVHGSGPALLFAHGGLGNQLSWWQQVPYFMERYTCVAYAQRGCGLSVEAPDGPGPDSFASDLGALIDHLGFDDVRLVGHSTGGRTVVQYAVREPTRVQAMVVTGSTGAIDDPEILEIGDRARPARERSELFTHTASLVLSDDFPREDPARAFLYGAVTRLTAMSRASDTEQRNKFFDKVMNLSTPTELVAKLEMPVLCIGGEHDRIWPPAAIERLAEIFQHGEAAIVPGVSHSVYWERPAEFNRLIDEFLVRVS